ncbi:MAG: hypothetical protein ABIR63_02420 [Sphingomicrobium sp.]
MTKKQKDDKAERLAAALRDNLRRRKAKVREAKSDASAEAGAPEDRKQGH